MGTEGGSATVELVGAIAAQRDEGEPLLPPPRKRGTIFQRDTSRRRRHHHSLLASREVRMIHRKTKKVKEEEKTCKIKQEEV